MSGVQTTQSRASDYGVSERHGTRDGGRYVLTVAKSGQHGVADAARPEQRFSPLTVCFGSSMVTVATVARRWFGEWCVFTVAETNSLRLEDSKQADELCDILGDKDRARVVKLKQVPQNSSSRPEHFAVVWDRRQHGDPDRRVVQAIMACLRLKRNTVLLAAVRDRDCIRKVLDLVQTLLCALADSVIVLTPTTACPGRHTAFARDVLCKGVRFEFLFGPDDDDGDGDDEDGEAGRRRCVGAGSGSVRSNDSGSLLGDMGGAGAGAGAGASGGESGGAGMNGAGRPRSARADRRGAFRSTGSLGFLPGDSEERRPESRAEAAWARAGGEVSPSGRAVPGGPIAFVGGAAGPSTPDTTVDSGGVPEPVVAAFERRKARYRGMGGLRQSDQHDEPSVSTALDSTAGLQPRAFRVIPHAPSASNGQLGSLESLTVTDSTGKINGRLSRGTPFTDLSSSRVIAGLDTAAHSVHGPPSRAKSQPNGPGSPSPLR